MPDSKIADSSSTNGSPLGASMRVADIIERVQQASALVSGIDLAAADSVALTKITAELRRLQSCSAGLGVAIAGRAKGLGDDPNATLLGRGQVSGKRARKETKRAGLTDRMPNLGDKLRNGEVSSEHVDAVANAVADLTADEAAAFAKLDAELADAASSQPVDTFRKNVRKAIDEQRADHGLSGLQNQRARSSLKMWTDADGMDHLHIISDPERMAKIRSAIERQTATLAAAAKASGRSVTLGPALQLDALIELIEGAQGPLGRPTITVLVDHETLVSGPHERTVCETSGGVPLPITVVERYTCDGLVQIVTLGNTGLPLDVGRTHRTATKAQWTALKAMYATCAWDGCDRSVDWCQAHHIHEWEHGGPTDLLNLVPLCSRHHHMVHDDGWRLKLRPDRTLEIHRPFSPDEADPGSDHRPHKHQRWPTAAPPRDGSSGSPSGSAPPTPAPPNGEAPWSTARPDRLAS